MLCGALFFAAAAGAVRLFELDSVVACGAGSSGRDTAFQYIKLFCTPLNVCGISEFRARAGMRMMHRAES